MIKHTMLYPHNLIFLLTLFSVVFNDLVMYVYVPMCNNLKDYIIVYISLVNINTIHSL